MDTFWQHLTESVKSSSGKNVHLEHLEDEILNDGYAGFQRSISAIRGVMETLSANAPTTHELTVKWDGAPAVICGINPDNGKFFVGTKGVFNVTPKLNYTNADIDRNHPNEGLNTKLKLALKYFKTLGISGILQGDLLFDRAALVREKIDGKPYITFKPNTITYAVEPNSDMGKRISAAKIGIVFHTAYDGNSMANLTARFNPDISGLKRSRNVWYDNATLRTGDGSGLFSPADRKHIERNIAVVMRTALGLRPLLRQISANEGVRVGMKTYINGLVRQNKTTASADANDLLRFMGDKVKTTRKKPSTKPTPSMEWIKRNRNGVNQVFALHNQLTQMKLVIVGKLESLQGGIGTFIKDGKGYRATAPEGFVAIDRLSNKAIKLVDRLDFSRANFTIAKSWKKD
jgi:hypothetical protein